MAERKNIVNKNSPNHGVQVVADTVINNTELVNKSLQDVRKLEITRTDSNSYRVTAVYVDGAKDEAFKANWYGWQNGGGFMPVWTPLGKSNSISLGRSTFTSISAWVFEQTDKEGADKNVHASVEVK
ncbi:hypothetical protein KC959_03520 [Candidatus Saccharibacteria bacterium]|nr:hypothetical protein [Candidatus Saccharibacteria bacterium]